MNCIHPLARLLIAAPFALAGCAGIAAPPADGRNVALGQSAYVDGPLVKPVEILEDSRCPAKVQCIWAGRVRLKMVWIRPSGEQPFEATLGEPVPLADGQFTLTDVRPAKQADRPTAPSDYRFTFTFQGGL